MGSEDWAVKRVWVCFFPEPTGDNFVSVCLLFVFFFFTVILYDHNLIFSYSTQEAQSAINDLTGKDDSVICYFLSFFFLVPYL